MRSSVFVDDSNDEQATTLHETGTGATNASFASRAFTTDTVRRSRVVADRSSMWFECSLLSHLFFPAMTGSLFREGLLVPLEKIPLIVVRLSHSACTSWGGS
jgi:hypothetical protein